MLADISWVYAIYIVCGRTDMRKQIDGICAIIEEKLHMGKDDNACSSSAGGVMTGSRRSCTKRMVLSSCIRGCLSMASSGGQRTRRK